jgi:hemolysin activation/secretion protein
MDSGWQQLVRCLKWAVVTVLLSQGTAHSQIDPGVLNPGVQQRENLPAPVVPQPKQGPLKPLLRQTEELKPTEEPTEERLQLKDLDFEGNSAIPDADLRAVVVSLLSRPVTFAEIQAGIDKLTALYRARGYVLSQAVLPQQTLVDGVLRIQIVEGYIERVEAPTDDVAFGRWLKGYFRPVLSQRPVSLATLERQILLAQTIPGLSLETVLSPGKQPGSSVLTLNTKRTFATGSLGLDNWVPQQLGNWRGTVSTGLNPFAVGVPWAVGLIGSYAWPYTNGLTNGVFTVSMPINSNGWQASGSFSYTLTNSDNLNTTGAPGVLSTRGESWYSSLALRYPLLISRRSNLFVSLQTDAQNSYSDLYFDNSLLQNNSIDRLRAIRLRFDGAWAGILSASQASLLISQGLPICGSDNGPDPLVLLSNPFGSTSFTTARASFGHQRRIGGASSPFQLNLKGEAQISATPLPSSEQLGYGGSSYGRAFRSIYSLGDQGAMGALELSFISKNLAGFVLQPYVFGDLGYTSLLRTSMGVPSAQTVSTYGLGLRINSIASSWLSLDTGWGIPASNTVQPQRTGLAEGIVYLRIAAAF